MALVLAVSIATWVVVVLASTRRDSDAGANLVGKTPREEHPEADSWTDEKPTESEAQPVASEPSAREQVAAVAPVGPPRGHLKLLFQDDKEAPISGLVVRLNRWAKIGKDGQLTLEHFEESYEERTARKDGSITWLNLDAEHFYSFLVLSSVRVDVVTDPAPAAGSPAVDSLESSASPPAGPLQAIGFGVPSGGTRTVTARVKLEATVRGMINVQQVAQAPSVMLREEGAETDEDLAYRVQAGRDGSFSFTGVPSGRYGLSARWIEEDLHSLFLRMPVEVFAEDVDLGGLAPTPGIVLPFVARMLDGQGRPLEHTERAEALNVGFYLLPSSALDSTGVHLPHSMSVFVPFERVVTLHVPPGDVSLRLRKEPGWPTYLSEDAIHYTMPPLLRGDAHTLAHSKELPIELVVTARRWIQGRLGVRWPEGDQALSLHFREVNLGDVHQANAAGDGELQLALPEGRYEVLARPEKGNACGRMELSWPSPAGEVPTVDIEPAVRLEMALDTNGFFSTSDSEGRFRTRHKLEGWPDRWQGSYQANWERNAAGEMAGVIEGVPPGALLVEDSLAQRIQVQDHPGTQQVTVVLPEDR